MTSAFYRCHICQEKFFTQPDLKKHIQIERKKDPTGIHRSRKRK